MGYEEIKELGKNILEIALEYDHLDEYLMGYPLYEVKARDTMGNMTFASGIVLSCLYDKYKECPGFDKKVYETLIDIERNCKSPEGIMNSLKIIMCNLEDKYNDIAPFSMDYGSLIQALKDNLKENHELYQRPPRNKIYSELEGVDKILRRYGMMRILGGDKVDEIYEKICLLEDNGDGIEIFNLFTDNKFDSLDVLDACHIYYKNNSSPQFIDKVQDALITYASLKTVKDIRDLLHLLEYELRKEKYNGASFVIDVRTILDRLGETINNNVDSLLSEDKGFAREIAFDSETFTHKYGYPLFDVTSSNNEIELKPPLDIIENRYSYEEVRQMNNDGKISRYEWMLLGSFINNVEFMHIMSGIDKFYKSNSSEKPNEYLTDFPEVLKTYYSLYIKFPGYHFDQLFAYGMSQLSLAPYNIYQYLTFLYEQLSFEKQGIAKFNYNDREALERVKVNLKQPIFMNMYQKETKYIQHTSYKNQYELFKEYNNVIKEQLNFDLFDTENQSIIKKEYESNRKGKYIKIYSTTDYSYLDFARELRESDIDIEYVDVDEGVEYDMASVSRHYGLEEFIDLSDYIESSAYDLDKLEFYFVGTFDEEDVSISVSAKENPTIVLRYTKDIELEDIFVRKRIEDISPKEDSLEEENETSSTVNIIKIYEGNFYDITNKRYNLNENIHVPTFIKRLYNTDFKPLKVKLYEGVEMEMQSVHGNEYLVDTFLQEYDKIKNMGSDLSYILHGTLGIDEVKINLYDDDPIVSISSKNPDIELEDILGIERPKDTLVKKGKDRYIELEINDQEASTGAIKQVKYVYEEYQEGRYLNGFKSEEVEIPQGTKTGQNICLPHKGHHGINGGEYGDLYIKIRVIPEVVFTFKEPKEETPKNNDNSTHDESFDKTWNILSHIFNILRILFMVFITFMGLTSIFMGIVVLFGGFFAGIFEIILGILCLMLVVKMYKSKKK